MEYYEWAWSWRDGEVCQRDSGEGRAQEGDGAETDRAEGFWEARFLEYGAWRAEQDGWNRDYG